MEHILLQLWWLLIPSYTSSFSRFIYNSISKNFTAFVLFKIKFSSVTFITSLETLKNAGWPFWNLAIIPLQSEHAYLYNQQNDLPRRSENKAKKKIQAWTGAEPLTAVIPVQCFTNWTNINQLANKPTHVYSFCVYYIHVMVTVQFSILKQD